MTPREPTTEDLFVADPLTREAGPRGVEPWEIVEGAPPVRGKRPAPRRSLLRDGTVHRGILEKARSTPTPAPPAHRREGERARKPDGHEREYFKPAAPLITNVVVDRPPPVRKAADPTWEPAPERAATPAPAAPEAVLPEEDPDTAWFFEADGTLEPAEERAVGVPPRRIAGFLAVGAALAAVALAAVAIGQGRAGSRAEAVAPPVVAAAPVAAPTPVEAPAPEVAPAGTADAAPVATPAPVAPAPVASAPAPVASAPATAPVAAPVAAKPVAVAPAREPAPTAAIDRLRASMSGNDLLGGPAPAPVAEPAPAPTEPVKIPEGSAELWGPIESTTAPAGGPWGDL